MLIPSLIKPFFSWKTYVSILLVGVVINAVVLFVALPYLPPDHEMIKSNNKILASPRGIYTGLCVVNADCGNHGTCVPNGVSLNGTCKCDVGFLTMNGQACSYQQKSGLAAFLISFFVGWLGAGQIKKGLMRLDWFYLSQGNGGYIVAGVFKLLTLGMIGIWSLIGRNWAMRINP
jgi:hypothetical protein